MIAAFCFGTEARRPFPSVPQQMFQPFSWLLLCARIKHSPQHLKPVRAPFFQRETVLQVPGCKLLRENAKITSEKFVAEEDFHRGNRKGLIDDKVNKDDGTICTSNVPDPPDKMAALDESICRGPLIFDPSPPIDV